MPRRTKLTRHSSYASRKILRTLLRTLRRSDAKVYISLVVLVVVVEQRGDLYLYIPLNSLVVSTRLLFSSLAETLFSQMTLL